MYQNLAITISDSTGDSNLRIATSTGNDHLVMSINNGDEFEFLISTLQQVVEAIVQFQKSNS